MLLSLAFWFAWRTPKTQPGGSRAATCLSFWCSRMDDWMVGWLGGWLVGCLVGWLVGYDDKRAGSLLVGLTMRSY